MVVTNKVAVLFNKKGAALSNMESERRLGVRDSVITGVSELRI